MAKKSGIMALWKRKDTKAYFEKAGLELEAVLLNLLYRTGEEFVKIARLSGQYIDHTGNLRSSIGYIVLRNGSLLNKDFRKSEKDGTDKQTGLLEGERLALSLIPEFSSGLVLICVAGMKYAAHVEAMDNKDVVSLAASKSEDFIERQSRSLFNRLGMAT